MLVIENVELSRNPVYAGESLKISVTIVQHAYLSKSTHQSLKAYTHGELTARGVILATHGGLKAYTHKRLAGKTHLQIRNTGG